MGRRGGRGREGGEGGGHVGRREGRMEEGRVGEGGGHVSKTGKDGRARERRG